MLVCQWPLSHDSRQGSGTLARLYFSVAGLHSLVPTSSYDLIRPHTGGRAPTSFLVCPSIHFPPSLPRTGRGSSRLDLCSLLTPGADRERARVQETHDQS